MPRTDAKRKKWHGLKAAILAALMPCAAFQARAIGLEEGLPTCLACHGEKGTSQNAEVPSLGAQMAPYVLIQLYLFREKQRLNEVMNAMTYDFTDADLQTFADAIAKLPPPARAPGEAIAKSMEAGRALVETYRCNFCHGADLSGQNNVPRIASQREDYLLKTLKEYKANTRHGYDGSMAEVLQPVSEAEIADLAYYISRQP
ncbi:MAG: c-type cytochrome [Rhodomicrobium sp.]